jgi:LysR family transcriptional regulator, hca operon transcriptional activator
MTEMELRHLRYFVAVAEAGSVSLAAERQLHTAQPSLSRQLRNLEKEVGAELFIRTVRGVQLTAAGRAFLEHARLALSQAEAATAAARRAAVPVKQIFAMGFLVGHEVDCLPHATALLRDELQEIDVRISSGFSVALAEELQRGRLDVAFLRREPDSDLEFKTVLQERLVAILPRSHRLAKRQALGAHDLIGETFIGISEIPRVLRGVVNGYLEGSDAKIVPHLEIDNFAMAISLVLSTHGVSLLPASIEGYLPPSIVSRKLKDGQPTVELVLGYHKANASPILSLFISRLDDLIARLSKTTSLAGTI